MLLQVVVSYTKQQKYHHLTTSLKKLGRNIGRGNRKSIATAAVANKTLRPALVHRLSQELRKNELKSGQCARLHSFFPRCPKPIDWTKFV